MPRPSRRSRVRSAISWVALALLGLVVAAVVSLAASRLSSQHIGLSSEPLTAGQRLTPAQVSAARREAIQATTTTHTTTPTPNSDPAPTAQTPQDGGSGKPDEFDPRPDGDD